MTHVSNEKRKESDKRYNEKMANVNVRIPNEIMNKIPEPKSDFIRTAIKKHLEDNQDRTATSAATSINLDHETLLILIPAFIEAKLEIEIPEHIQAYIIRIIESELK